MFGRRRGEGQVTEHLDCMVREGGRGWGSVFCWRVHQPAGYYPQPLPPSTATQPLFCSHVMRCGPLVGVDTQPGCEAQQAHTPQSEGFGTWWMEGGRGADMGKGEGGSL